MNLIPNWRDAWKFLSLRGSLFFATVGTVVMAVFLQQPPDVQGQILSFIGVPITLLPFARFVFDVWTRLKAQPELYVDQWSEPPADPEFPETRRL